MPREEDIRLLELVLDDVVLSDAVAGYAGASGGTLLPLGATSDLLSIAITVDANEGTASGFILNEKRTFHLDVARREVTVAGRPRRYDRELVRVFEDDIYVDSTLLAEWLPVGFDIDLFSLRVRVRPREPLPLQTRLERERRIRHWRLRLPPPDPGYPRHRTSYGLFDAPFVDQTLRLSLGQEETTANFATYATGDLLFMESEAYLAGDHEDPLDDWRMTLRRRDPAGALGGFLHATEFALGHVIHPTSALLATTSDPAPGILLTNLPLHRAAEYDRHSFRGNLPPGWDVELHHNGALVDYQSSRPDGLYAFENVPLLFGMNFFRLVFHGPQGQRREEDHRFLLGESLTLPGHFEYRLVANVESEAERRASMLLSYGISRHLTATAEVASLPTPFDERRYGKFGLRTFWSAFFAYADYAQDEAGAHAYEAGVQTRILGVNLSASRTGLSRGFTSDAFRFAAEPILTRDRLRVDTAIPAWILPRIPISVEVERQRLVSGSVRTVVQNRISTNYKGMSITNRALVTATTGQPDRFDAGLQFSRYIRRFGVRGELLYTLRPMTFTTANFIVERPIRDGYRMYMNVSRSFLGSHHVYGIGIDKTTGAFAAGVDARRDAAGQPSMNVNLSAGLGHDPREGGWEPSARSRAPFGAVSPRVFLDRNLNGILDAGDESLKGVGFTINGIERAERTGASGIAYLPELSPHQALDIAIDARTLEDPQWVASAPGVRITPRPGKAATLDFPVIATTEIEGTITATRRGRTENAGGVSVELVDSKGNVVQKTKSAYDGFYVLTGVRPGKYEVRIGDGITQRIEVAPGQPLIAGIDLHVPGAPTPAAPPVVVAEAPPRPAPAAIDDPETPLPPVRPITPTGPSTPTRPMTPTPMTPTRSAQAPIDEPAVVQLGSFTVPTNAQRLAARVRGLAADVTVTVEGKYHVVRTGRRSRSEALALQRELAAHGIDALVVTPPATTAIAASAPPRRGSFVVQLGTFSIARNAAALVRRLASYGATIRRSGDLYVVEAGPYETRDEAATVRDAVRRQGGEAIVSSR